MTIYHDAIEKLGRRSQFNKALEEIAELNLALQHYSQGKCLHDDLLDEIVDVSIMLEQLKIMLEIDDKTFADVWQRKLARLQGILDRQ